MRTKEYVGNLHRALAEDHREMASDHKALAGATSKLMDCMTKADSDDKKKARDAISEMISAHEAAAKSHLQRAFDHDKNAEECMKAAESDLRKVAPDGISSVFTVDAPPAAFGIRAVPRPGAPSSPELSKATIASIDPRFRHLVSDMQEVE